MLNQVKTAVLWDWDNTLINTKDVILKALSDVTAKYHLPSVTPEQVRSIMGTYRGAYWQAFGDKMEEALVFYLSRYVAYADQAAPFPGSADVLEFVREQGALQFVVSNKRQDLLDKEVTRIGWQRFFNGIQGTGPAHDSKPHKSFADTLLKGYDFKRLIMIGDGESDMFFARNIGARAILVHNTAGVSQWPHDVFCSDLKAVYQVLKTEL